MTNSRNAPEHYTNTVNLRVDLAEARRTGDTERALAIEAELRRLMAIVEDNMRATVEAAQRDHEKRTDRRSRTSRANLGDHVPAPLGAGDSQVITVRLPAELAVQLDAEVARSGLTRSDIVRWCVEHALPESRKVPPYQPW